MSYPAYDVDRPIHVLRGIVKAGIAGIDVRMAGLAGSSRRDAAVGRVGRRESVTSAAAGGGEVIRLTPDGRLVCASGKCGPVTVGVRALKGRLVINRAQPAGLRERPEQDSARLHTRRIGLRPEKMIEGDRAKTIVALAADVGHVEGAVARMGAGDVGIDGPVRGPSMAGGAVQQSIRKTAPVAEGAACSARHSSNAVQVRAVAAGAGIEARGADLAVEIPRRAQRIDRGYDAEEGWNLKTNARMGRQRDVADLASRIGAVNEPSELDIKARFAARPARGVVRMALLAKSQVGLGCRAVVDRLRPAGGMSHYAVAKRAVKAGGLPRGVGGDDRGPKIGPSCVAEGAGSGVQPRRIVNSVGVGRRRVGAPGSGRMGRPYRDAVRHVARTGGPAARKTAHPRYAAGEVCAVTGLATGEACLGSRLRFCVSAVQCRVTPSRSVPGRSVSMADLPVAKRDKTTHQ